MLASSQIFEFLRALPWEDFYNILTFKKNRKENKIRKRKQESSLRTHLEPRFSYSLDRWSCISGLDFLIALTFNYTILFV